MRSATSRPSATAAGPKSESVRLGLPKPRTTNEVVHRAVLWIAYISYMNDHQEGSGSETDRLTARTAVDTRVSALTILELATLSLASPTVGPDESQVRRKPQRDGQS